jgi:hypothetical protein
MDEEHLNSLFTQEKLPNETLEKNISPLKNLNHKIEESLLSDIIENFNNFLQKEDILKKYEFRNVHNSPNFVMRVPLNKKEMRGRPDGILIKKSRQTETGFIGVLEVKLELSQNAFSPQICFELVGAFYKTSTDVFLLETDMKNFRFYLASSIGNKPAENILYCYSTNNKLFAFQLIRLFVLKSNANGNMSQTQISIRTLWTELDAGLANQTYKIDSFGTQLLNYTNAKQSVEYKSNTLVRSILDAFYVKNANEDKKPKLISKDNRSGRVYKIFIEKENLWYALKMGKRISSKHSQIDTIVNEMRCEARIYKYLEMRL